MSKILSGGWEESVEKAQAQGIVSYELESDSLGAQAFRQAADQIETWVKAPHGIPPDKIGPMLEGIPILQTANNAEELNRNVRLLQLGQQLGVMPQPDENIADYVAVIARRMEEQNSVQLKQQQAQAGMDRLAKRGMQAPELSNEDVSRLVAPGVGKIGLMSRSQAITAFEKQGSRIFKLKNPEAAWRRVGKAVELTKEADETVEAFQQRILQQYMKQSSKVQRVAAIRAEASTRVVPSEKVDPELLPVAEISEQVARAGTNNPELQNLLEVGSRAVRVEAGTEITKTDKVVLGRLARIADEMNAVGKQQSQSDCSLTKLQKQLVKKQLVLAHGPYIRLQDIKLQWKAYHEAKKLSFAKQLGLKDHWIPKGDTSQVNKFVYAQQNSDLKRLERHYNPSRVELDEMSEKRQSVSYSLGWAE